MSDDYDSLEEHLFCKEKLKKTEKSYYELKKEFKDKINYSSLNSSEIVKVSQKIDEYIVQAMKELNFNK